jgi:hypothetical protein
MLPDIVSVAGIFFQDPQLSNNELAETRAKVWTKASDPKVISGKLQPSGLI